MTSNSSPYPYSVGGSSLWGNGTGSCREYWRGFNGSVVDGDDLWSSISGAGSTQYIEQLFGDQLLNAQKLEWIGSTNYPTSIDIWYLDASDEWIHTTTIAIDDPNTNDIKYIVNFYGKGFRFYMVSMNAGNSYVNNFYCWYQPYQFEDNLFAIPPYVTPPRDHHVYAIITDDDINESGSSNNESNDVITVIPSSIYNRLTELEDRTYGLNINDSTTSFTNTIDSPTFTPINETISQHDQRLMRVEELLNISIEDLPIGTVALLDDELVETNSHFLKLTAEKQILLRNTGYQPLYNVIGQMYGDHSIF
jgi:hypothetical protein